MVTKAALQGAPGWLSFVAGGPPTLVDDLSSTAWADVCLAADQGGVLDALIVRLRAEERLSALPGDLGRFLEGRERMGALTHLAHQRTFVQVAAALFSADVPVVLYKGFELAHTVYPEARMRPMTDIDLWVREEALQPAMETLAATGLVRKPARTHRSRFPRSWDGEVKLRRPEAEDTVAELHHGPFPGEWLHRAARIDRAAVWDRLRPGNLLGHPVKRLAAEDHALEVALHTAINHQLGYVPLRSFLDLVLLARTGLAIDVLVGRAQAWQVTRAVRLAFCLAAACFDDPATARVCAQLRLARPHDTRLRTLGLPTIDDVLRGKRLSRTRIARYMYFLQLTHGWRNAVRLLAPGVWPQREWLKARYGSAGPAARLWHLRVLLSRDRFGGRPRM